MPGPPRPSTDLIRVVIVDADDRTRESLGGLLEISGRIEIVGSAGRTDRAVELVAATRPDVVVVDPRLAGPDDGMVLIARLRARWPDLGILAIGPSGSLESEARARGGDGYARKTYRPAELVAAIDSVRARPAGRSG